MAKANRQQAVQVSQKTVDAVVHHVQAQEQVRKVVAGTEATATAVEQPKALDDAMKMDAGTLIAIYGNKSNAIRGLAALGAKTGDIAKKLGVIYQHARNVLKRPLKREIKEQRDNAKAQQGNATPATK